MMAARSLIGTFRRIIPDLLHKKDRGRPTEANVAIEAPKYGEVRANEFVPGAEVLLDKRNESTEETDNSASEVSKILNYFSSAKPDIILLHLNLYIYIRVG